MGTARLDILSFNVARYPHLYVPHHHILLRIKAVWHPVRRYLCTIIIFEVGVNFKLKGGVRQVGDNSFPRIDNRVPAGPSIVGDFVDVVESASDSLTVET